MYSGNSLAKHVQAYKRCIHIASLFYDESLHIKKKIDYNHCGVRTCTCVEVKMLIFLKNAHCPDFKV